MSILPEETKERIKELWTLGWSSTKIGLELGLTRNSVIGVVHRMRQKGISIPSNRKTTIKKKYTREKETKARSERDKYYESPTDIFGLRMSSCRFIVEEGTVYTTKYCNQKAHKASYCKDHYKICYYKPAKPASKLRIPV